MHPALAVFLAFSTALGGYAVGSAAGKLYWKPHEINSIYDGLGENWGKIIWQSGPHVYILPGGYHYIPNIEYAIKFNHIKLRQQPH